MDAKDLLKQFDGLLKKRLKGFATKTDLNILEKNLKKDLASKKELDDGLKRVEIEIREAENRLHDAIGENGREIVGAVDQSMAYKTEMRALEKWVAKLEKSSQRN